ncbi:TPA: hypothetical protein QDB14_004192 [Burkholderia vietnamiensis]|nr:hypothetical protein [Burkholderia vietnamiensis]
MNTTSPARWTVMVLDTLTRVMEGCRSGASGANCYAGKVKVHVPLASVAIQFSCGIGVIPVMSTH